MKIVDGDTGEILHILKEGDRSVVVRKNSMDAYCKMQAEIDEKNFDFKYVDFGVFNIDELPLLSRDLSGSEKILLLILIPFISFNSCCLINKDGTDMTVEDMMYYSGLSKNTAYKALKGLVSKDVVYKGKNSNSFQYFLNPWLCFKGKKINKTLKHMFKNYQIRSFNYIRWSDLEAMKGENDCG